MNIIDKMKKYFDECSEKYFTEYKNEYPEPKFLFEIIDEHENIGMMYVYFWNKSQKIEKTEIALNSKFKDHLDDTMIRSVMFHETIHYYDAYINHNFNKNDEHGEYFMKKMKEINEGEGENYIGIKSDMHVQTTEKSFYIYFVTAKPDQYMYFWTSEKNNKAVEWISSVAEAFDLTKYFVFETKRKALQEGAELDESTKIKYTLLDNRKNKDLFDVFNDARKKSIVKVFKTQSN